MREWTVAVRMRGTNEKQVYRAQAYTWEGAKRQVLEHLDPVFVRVLFVGNLARPRA